MNNESNNNESIYKVVVNQEEQFSIWPTDRELPIGWSEEGTHGTKSKCLEYIAQIWTDMRPKSLRNHMKT